MAQPQYSKQEIAQLRLYLRAIFDALPTPHLRNFLPHIHDIETYFSAAHEAAPNDDGKDTP